jgi:ribonuclease P protein component
VGLVVPLHRHTAVDRNRLKRRLREVVRQELLPRLGPLDVVFRTTEAAYRLPFDGLRAAVGEAGRRLWAKEGNE